MAFRGLVEGDCGTPSSLISLASHYVKDHGFKEEGIHRPFDLPNTFQTPNGEQLAQEFIEQSACPQTFRMDGLLQGINELDQNIPPPIAPPPVVQDLARLDAKWANQYFERQSRMHAAYQEHRMHNIWNVPAIRLVREKRVHFSETQDLGLNPNWAEGYVERSIDTVENKDVDEGGDPEFMKFLQQRKNVPIESEPKWSFKLDDTAEELVEEYLTDKSKLDDNATGPSTGTLLNSVEEELEAAGTGWTDEFIQSSRARRNEDTESVLWKQLEMEWDKATYETALFSAYPWMSEFDANYDPFKDYEFNVINPMKNLPEALEEGKRRLEVGDLPSAILCFEAAVQQDENNAEAWLLLGRTQAENEQDRLAIPALKRCLSLDTSNCAALMELAVSYTNESYQRQACLTLKEWLLKNEKYKHLSVPKPNLDPSLDQVDRRPRFNMSTILYDDVYKEVEELYIQAARMNPQGEIDPDVQCGLGVLFNLSSDYEKAADCFKTALQMHPNDCRLWNRWGATLANGNRSAEAVSAYHRALELSPGFIRARYNLGISCINLRAYKQAGEHLLTALNQQAAGIDIRVNILNPRTMSSTIWATLRLVLSLMRKYHMTEAAEKRDLQKLNEEFEVS